MDLSRDELMRQAEAAIMASGGPTRAFVHFKYSCVFCGERCVLREPNTLRERGKCVTCGMETIIRSGGFMLVIGDPDLIRSVMEKHDG